MAAPSLEVFKTRLDGALGSLLWWEVSLLMAGGMEPGDPYGPCQPKPFCDSKLFCYQEQQKETKGIPTY